MLKDIAILTGGEVITSELGLELKDTQITQLGRARQIVISKENTIIVDGAGDSEAIKARVAQIRAEIENSTSDFDREKLQERVYLRGNLASLYAADDRLPDACSLAEPRLGEGRIASNLGKPFQQAFLFSVYVVDFFARQVEVIGGNA
jgi:hypothetical protein